MPNLISGPDSADFLRSERNSLAGRIRVEGSNFIVRTNSGEVIIPMLSVLAATGAGEGAQAIGVDDSRFVSKDIEGALSELRALVDHGASSAQVTSITPVELYNLVNPPDPNGFNDTEYDLSFLPAQATHAVIEFHTRNCNGCTMDLIWYGVAGNQPGQGGNPMFKTDSPEQDSIIQTLLPISTNRAIHLNHQWQVAHPPTPNFGKATVVGWMEIPGISEPLDHF